MVNIWISFFIVVYQEAACKTRQVLTRLGQGECRLFICFYIFSFFLVFLNIQKYLLFGPGECQLLNPEERSGVPGGASPTEVDDWKNKKSTCACTFALMAYCRWGKMCWRRQSWVWSNYLGRGGTKTTLLCSMWSPRRPRWDLEDEGVVEQARWAKNQKGFLNFMWNFDGHCFWPWKPDFSWPKVTWLVWSQKGILKT